MSGPAARTTALGAAWNYGAQLSTVVVQLGYAALSSRLLGPEAFGQYGVALIVASFVTLLATAGLPQAVSRMEELDGPRLSALLCYAVVVGCVASAFMVLTAGAWAALWGVPGSADVLRPLAVGSFFAPVLAVGTGVLLRSGRFRTLATATFVANVGGMAIGLLAIAAFRTPAMLVVSPILGQGGAALACLVVARRHFLVRPRREGLSVDLPYSARVTFSSLLSYTGGNVGKLALSNAFGAALLGNWNRAEVLTSVPFYQVQNALVQALYPEFRHDIGSTERARRVWADLLGLVTWLCLPLASVLAATLPVLVPVVFGPGWSVVGQLLPALAIIAGLQTTAFVLVSALEVLGRFRWIWAGHLTTLAVNGIGGLLALALDSFVPVLAAAIASLVVMHALHVHLCTRAGLLQPRVLAGHYAAVALTSIGLAAAGYLVVHLPELSGGRPWLPVVVAGALGAAAVLAWRHRERLPVVVLLRKYRLLGR